MNNRELTGIDFLWYAIQDLESQGTDTFGIAPVLQSLKANLLKRIIRNQAEREVVSDLQYLVKVSQTCPQAYAITQRSVKELGNVAIKKALKVANDNSLIFDGGIHYLRVDIFQR